jgi:hypothetical protein
MKKLLATSLMAAALLPFAAARADHARDDRSGDYAVADSRGYKDKYRVGDCEIKRKWKKNGEYKEERKCKAPRHVEPAAMPSYPVAPAGPGIVVNGTAVILP